MQGIKNTALDVIPKGKRNLAVTNEIGWVQPDCSVAMSSYYKHFVDCHLIKSLIKRSFAGLRFVRIFVEYTRFIWDLLYNYS